MQLFEHSAHPFCLLDHRRRVRFVNAALSQLCGCERESMIGIDCSRCFTEGLEQSPPWVSRMLIPSTVEMPSMDITIDENLLDRKTAGRIFFPLVDGRNNHFLAIVWLSGNDRILQVLDEDRLRTETKIDVNLRTFLDSFPRVEGLLSLVGSSQVATLARRQIQAACSGQMSVLIIGPDLKESEAIGKAIYAYRRKRDRHHTRDQTFLPIDCRLMDRTLMHEMLELCRSDSESTSDSARMPQHLLLLSLDCLAVDAQDVLLAYLHKHPQTVLISTSLKPDLFRRYPASQTWSSIATSAAVLQVIVPPISERSDDLPSIVASLIEQHQTTKSIVERKRFSEDAMQRIVAYAWPGNYSELKRSVSEALEAATTSEMGIDLLPIALQSFPSHELIRATVPPIDLDGELLAFEKRLLMKAMADFPKNRAAAARHLGISRTRLLRRLSQLGLEANVEPRDEPPSSISPSVMSSRPSDFASSSDELLTKDDTSLGELEVIETSDPDVPIFEELPFDSDSSPS